MAVLGIKPPATGAGEKAPRQGHGTTVISTITDHMQHRAATVREVDQLAAESTPLILRHPHLSAGRVVQHPWNPHEGRIVGRRFRGPFMHRHVAVKPSGLNHIQSRLWHPRALLIRGGDDSAGAHTKPIRIAKTSGHNREPTAIGRHLQQHPAMRRVLSAANEIQIPFRIGLQTGGIRMSAAADHDVVVECLIKIRLTVLITIMQPRDLVAA